MKVTMTSFLCPVWEGHGFSEYFDDMVFGLGGNLVTLIMVAVIAISRRGVRWSGKKHLQEKILMRIFPALEVALLSFNMVMMRSNSGKGYVIEYYDWIFKCSRISVWVMILLFSLGSYCWMLFCNWILCYWWIVRAVLQVPHLQRTLSSSEALQCFQEGAVVLLDLMFGIYINIIRMKCAASVKGSAEEEPLLHDVDLEDGLNDSQEIASSFCHCMTFNNIHPVLEQGVKKQLDFQDLLPLPPDMNPSLCHDTLRMSWEAQQITNCSNASLLKAIWSAYGWPYFCLGLLKVCNDCIGFAGPLLLNKLIRFLQKGGRSRDGIGLAISLGLVALLKSFLDTQYTYRLSKLKLRLRSSIMMMIYEKCLHVTLVERSIFSEGEIQTFMSVDADRTVNLFTSLHDVWSLPLQISIALYLLYTQVNFAFLSGVAITVLLIPGTSSVTKNLFGMPLRT